MNKAWDSLLIDINSYITFRRDYSVDQAEKDYRKEQIKYYTDVAKIKLIELPTIAKALGALVILLFFMLIFKSCSGNNATPPPPPVTKTIDNIPVQVPNLVHVERLEAIRRLNQLGFTNIDAQGMSEFGDAASKEIVIEQAPAAGTRLSKGDKIIIRYGSERLYNKSLTTIEMPDVSGLTIDNATKLLKDKGFEKVTFNKPVGYDQKQLVVDTTSPSIGSKTNLNTAVSLSVKPGMQMDEVKQELAANYVPFTTFDKVENPEGLTLKITLLKNDKSLKDAASLNERARTHLVAIESIIGYKLDKVILVNPGVKVQGDSNDAVRKITDDGLTVQNAQDACEQEANNNNSQVDFNWTSGLLQKEVNQHNIVFTVTATMTDDSGNKQESVVYCVVSGDNNNSKVDKYTIK